MLFTVLPYSISTFSSSGSGGSELQPSVLSPTTLGASSWASYDATRDRSLFSRSFPVFINMAIQRDAVDFVNPFSKMTLSLLVDGAADFNVRACILPFNLKYGNYSPAGVLDSVTTKTISVAPAIPAALVSSVESSWEFSQASFVSGSGSPVLLNLDLFIGSNEENPTNTNAIVNPKIAEYIKRVMCEGDPNPEITIMVWTQAAATSYILEHKSAASKYTKCAAYKFHTTNASSTVFRPDFLNNSFMPSVGAIKQSATDQFKYSLGIGSYGVPRNFNGSSYVNISDAGTDGQLLRSRGHVANEIVAADDMPVNLLFNGDLSLGSTGSPARPAGWSLNLRGSFASSISTYNKSDANFPFKTEEQTVNVAEITMNDTGGTTRAFEPYAISINNNFQSYSTIYSNIGCQTEYEEEYIAQCWVKITSGAAGEKIRMSYVGPYIEIDGSSGYVDQVSTATAASGNSSADCPNDGQWHLLWVKVKKNYNNAWLFTRFFHEGLTTPKGVGNDIKQTWNMIRLDHLGTASQVTFLLAGISLLKLNGREINSTTSGISIVPKNSATASSASDMDGSDYHWFLMLRGNKTLLHKPTGTTYAASTDAGVVSVTSADATNYGGQLVSPHSESRFKFQTFVFRDASSTGRGSILRHTTGSMSLLNPSEGSIEFWYCPYKSSESQGSIYMFSEPDVIATGIADPVYGNEFKNYQFQNYTADVYSDLGYAQYYKMPGIRNIVTIGNLNSSGKGNALSGAGLTFFRRNKVLGVLIYENVSRNNTHDNASPLSQGHVKFKKLEYLIPDSLYRMINFANSPIPCWFHLKFTWGVRQEFYVNGTLADMNNIPGLWTAPDKLQSTTDINNIYPNTLYLGNVEGVSGGVGDLPLLYSDNYLIHNLMISPTSKHQTYIVSNSEKLSWKGIETLNTISTGTISITGDSSVGSGTIHSDNPPV